MRDFLPADVRRREYVIGIIKEVYERYGFEPLETPAVENIETLMGKYGEEGNQLIFKILKRGEHEKTGEADLALRYDLTVPLARVVAQYQNELPKFFKRYQIQPVWRADRPARGRFREFYQCDVDILGSRSMLVETEICAAASEVLTKLGFEDFNLRLNHRNIIEGLLDSSLIPKSKYADCLVALDKLDKVGVEGVDESLAASGISEESRKLLRKILQPAAEMPAYLIEHNPVGWNDMILQSLSKLIGNHTIAQHGITELREILRLTKISPAKGQIIVDPTLARGLSYYTGAIMEINVKDLAGSLGGGGRYDNLVGMFSGQDVPACGFSLGLERIIVVMTESGMFPQQLVSSPADVMVSIWNDESIADSVAVAQELRRAGLRVDVYPEPDKLGKQFKYASARGIPFVVVVGDEEKARGEVSIKDMRSGEQRSLEHENVADAIRARLK